MEGVKKIMLDKHLDLSTVLVVFMKKIVGDFQYQIIRDLMF